MNNQQPTHLQIVSSNPQDPPSNTPLTATDGLPLWLDRRSWAEYEEWRQMLASSSKHKGRRYPWTEAGRRHSIRILARIVDEHDCSQEDVIGQSLANGWVGLFPPKR